MNCRLESFRPDEALQDQPFPFTIGPLQESHTGTVCSWATTREELRMIASEPEDRLTPELIAAWSQRSIESLVFLRAGLPVGFCTLSTDEAPHRMGAVEMCHLVIAPEWRRRYFATTFVNMIRLYSAERHFEELFARVVPANTSGMALSQYVRWMPRDADALGLDDQFNWFAYELRR